MHSGTRSWRHKATRSAAMSDDVLENLKLPTELSRDPTNLQRIAANIRATINVSDPASLYYNRPDLAKEAELRLKALEIRAGALTPQLTPERLAAEQTAQHWDVKPNPAFEQLLANRTADLLALGDARLEERASALAEIGPPYFTMLEQAKAGLGFAEVVALVVRSDEHLLRQAAARGRFHQAKQRAKL